MTANRFEQNSAQLILDAVLTLLAVVALLALSAAPARAQTTSTWTGGAGDWSDCPPSGNALWNTCPDPPNGLGWPNGNFNAVINGGPVTATSASIVNMSIGSGDSLVFASGTTGLLSLTGSSIVNNGSISIASGNGMFIQGPTSLTISGTGSISVANSRFNGSSSPVPTVTLQQPVSGNGAFSLGMNLVNQSTINATGGTLEMQPTSVVNTGTIEASSGGILEFSPGGPVSFNNTGGTIEALSGGTVQLSGSTYTGGILTSDGSGIIQLLGDAILNNLTNTGTLQVSDNSALLQGTVTNNGTISVQSSGQLFMSGSVTLAGSGSLNLTSSGELEANFTSVGLSGGTLTNQQLIHGTGEIYQLPLTNTGTIAADSSGNTLALAGGTITNTASLQASSGGTLEIETVVNNSGGTIEALNGSTVVFTSNFDGSINGGTLTTSGTGVIQSQNGVLDGTVNVPTNAGMLTASNGYNLAIQGTINNTGTIALTDTSCVQLNAPSTLTGSGVLTLADACIYGSGIPFTNKSTIEGTGSIGDSNPMPITNAGTIIANQPTQLIIAPNSTGFINTGTLIANAGSTLNVSGLLTNLKKGTLTGGTYSASGTIDIQGPISTNSANITLNGAGAEIYDNYDEVNAFTALTTNSSKGALTLENGQSLTTKTNLATQGKLTVGAGSSLTLGGSFTQTAGTTTVDGTLTAPSGLTLEKGTLQGKGTLASAVTSDATINVGDSASKAGKLTVNGTFTQNAAGTLDVTIGGTAVGTQYSQLAVSNGASLNGTLSIKRTASFVPNVGTTFTILTASAVSGEFSSVKGTSINSAEHFDVGYESGSVVLTVASGP